MADPRRVDKNTHDWVLAELEALKQTERPSPVASSGQLGQPGHAGRLVFLSDLKTFALDDGDRWLLPDTYRSAFQTSTFTETVTSFGNTTQAQMGRCYAIDGKAMFDAGWRPEVRITGQVQCSTSNIAYVALRIFQINTDDTGYSAIALDKLEQQESKGAGIIDYVDSGWVTLTDGDFSPAPSESHWMFLLSTKVSAGTGTYDDLLLEVRWVKP